MATINGTKEQLLEAHMEIQQFQKYQPTIATMLGGRIESFYRNNEAKLQAVHEGRLAIYKKYVQPTDDGRGFKFAKLKEEDTQESEVLIEPVIELLEPEKTAWMDKQRKTFKKELNEYLNLGVSWII